MQIQVPMEKVQDGIQQEQKCNNVKIIIKYIRLYNNRRLLADMHIRNYRKQTLTTRMIILAITTFFFITSFVLNITSDQALYQYNLNIVPVLQSNNVLGSKGFMVFMNIISFVFDPSICAAYIFFIYLISYRKLQIIAFLLWFFFLSWLLGIMKMSIHQARPFWVPGSQVKMQSWTCYTDYGCPSGHSMLAIVLLEFLLRFYARVHKVCDKHICIGYILVFTAQLLVMFSRMMLGMHSLNQVLFGCSIGLYSFIPYYLFVQNFIMKMLLKMFNHPKSMLVNVIVITMATVMFSIQLLIALLPQYDTAIYFQNIKNTSGCSKATLHSSFQYACLAGTSIVSAGYGTIVGLNYLKRPYNLYKILGYTRISFKFAAKVFLTIIITIIPLIVFMNPLWNRIHSNNVGEALIKWATQNAAFFLAVFFIVFISQLIGECLGLQDYKSPTSYAQFRQYQVLQIGDTQILIPKQRETELTTPKASDLGSKYR